MEQHDRSGLPGPLALDTARTAWRQTSQSDAELGSDRCVKGWLSPGDWLAIAIAKVAGNAKLYKRTSDGVFTTVATSGTGLSLTTNNWYTMKVVVDDPNDPNNPGQRLGWDRRLACRWVDTDD